MRGIAWLVAMLGTFAVFFGAGSRVWWVAWLGGGLLAIAVLLRLGAGWLVNRAQDRRSYVFGTVHVVQASAPPDTGARFGRCELVLLVDAPGIAARTVSVREPRVPVNRWPEVGDALPAQISVVDVRRIRIEWDRVAERASSEP